VPGKPAIVANVTFAVGTNRGAIRPAAEFGNDVLLARRQHPRQAAACDLHHDNAAIGQRDRSFRECQIGGDFPAA